MKPAVQVRVLGPLEVHRGGRPCPVRSRLQRRLLTALTIGAGTTSSTDHLIDQLWGDQPPPAARNSLQSHVARLRGLVGDETIVTRPPGYALDVANVEVDAVAFERAVEGARSQLDTDPAAAALALRAALAEWRGAAHAEFAEDLARADALRLEHLRIDARRLLAEAQLLAGDRPAAVDTVLRLHGDVPLREDVTLAAARTLHAVARTAEALELLRTHRSRVNDELGLDPGRAVAELEQQLLRGEPTAVPGPAPPRTGRRSPGTLEPHDGVTSTGPTPAPSADTDTLGRERELAHVAHALADARLVTLVGPGGVGKTRLATVAVKTSDPSPAPPVAWVDLATVTSPADVAPLIVECLGLSSPDRAAPETAAAGLARFPGTVVLDNCEHVLDDVTAVVRLALARDGPARVLATSRERLDLAQEQVVLVAPLPVPDPRTASDQDPAVRLFQERLVAAGATAVAAADAARVAVAVDGLPLAIELAAARATTLSVEELLTRLGHHLELLAGSSRRHGERHRTLSNVIAWSHDLLAERDRTVLRRASVFASSFRLSDAEQVCCGPDLAPTDVVEAIARLVETSMLTRTGAGRYRLLEPLRVFARSRLARSPDEEATWARHRAMVLALVDRADADLTGRDEVRTLAELEDALPDLRAVHARAVADGDLATVARMAGRLYRFAYAQARGDVLAWGGRLVAADAADLAPDERLRAVAASVPAEVWHHHGDEALRRAALVAAHLGAADVDPWTGITLAETLGDLHLMHGELTAAVSVYERGVELARRCDHVGLTAYMLAGLSVATAFLGDGRRATRLAEQAGDLARVVGSPIAVSLAAYALGESLAEDDPERALHAFEAAVDAASAARAPFFEAIARTADVALRGRYGDPAAAFDRYWAALGIWRDTSADGMAVTTLRNLVVLLARTGADADALALHTSLERFASRRSYGAEADRLDAALAAVGQRLSSADRDRAAELARSVTGVTEAIAFGLGSIDRATQH